MEADQCIGIRPPADRRIFGAHAAHLRAQLLRYSLTHARCARCVARRFTRIWTTWSPNLSTLAGGRMPELPEVETIVADLRPHLTGRTIVSCELPFPTIVRHPEPEVFVDSVAGMRINAMRRRGKFILMDLDSSLLLVVHLGLKE